MRDVARGAALKGGGGCERGAVRGDVVVDATAWCTRDCGAGEYRSFGFGSVRQRTGAGGRVDSPQSSSH
jgi:hypothetical protein